MDINFFIWRDTPEKTKNFIFKRAELDILKVDETVDRKSVV